MKFNRLVILTAFFFSSCATIHTGPLLVGDVPLNFGRCHEGEVYTDPEQRFQVVCPFPGAVKNIKNTGISFNNMDSVFDTVLVYDRSSDIDAILKDYKLKLSGQRVTMDIKEDENMSYRGYSARNFNFLLKSKEGNIEGIDVTRFVKTQDYVYWIHYSSLVAQEIRPHDLTEASIFFDSVKLKREFGQV